MILLSLVIWLSRVLGTRGFRELGFCRNSAVLVVSFLQKTAKSADLVPLGAIHEPDLCQSFSSLFLTLFITYEFCMLRVSFTVMRLWSVSC
jgi:hypothetical protein